MNLGAEIDLSSLREEDPVKLLFAQNPGVLLQVRDTEAIRKIFGEYGVEVHVIGRAKAGKELKVKNGGESLSFNVPQLRDTWYKSSYLLDRRQSGAQKAKERYDNYKQQPLSYVFPQQFTGQAADMGLDPARRTSTGIKAAIIREQGSNSEREMAHALYLAGFDVKDVHMTDLIEGREDLSDVNLIAAVGGFSNSDVLGSAKGWAGSFKYNEKARKALENFFARQDTLSLGICNGCQLFIELGLINPEHTEKPSMLHNDSHKHECAFGNVDIPENNSVMFSTLSGSRLGVWVSHGEGKFNLPLTEDSYNIAARYSYSGYPGNPNGSDYDVAALASADGRHLVMMPHMERSVHPWTWGYYNTRRAADEVSPWLEAFVNARKWVEKNKK